jgi:hypothetical protein
MDKFVILGAGMSGLLAASMLRDQCDRIIEAAGSLPSNHHSVLRFRTDQIATATGIMFRKVDVIRAVHPYQNEVASAVAYSKKVTGKISQRSVANKNGVVQRFIAPNNFVARLAEGINATIKYGVLADAKMILQLQRKGYKIISTIPMPLMVEMFPGVGGEIGRQEFEKSTTEAIHVKAQIKNCEMFCSLYVPDPDLPVSRISITGSSLHVESTSSNAAELNRLWPKILAVAGIDKNDVYDTQYFPAKYAKIVDINEQARRQVIMDLSTKHGIYSLGRYATWKPRLLLDDLVNDMNVIKRLAAGAAAYDQIKRG